MNNDFLRIEAVVAVGHQTHSPIAVIAYDSDDGQAAYITVLDGFRRTAGGGWAIVGHYIDIETQVDIPWVGVVKPRGLATSFHYRGARNTVRNDD